MKFFRQEYQSGLLFPPPPGHLPNPRIKPWSSAWRVCVYQVTSVVSDSLWPHGLCPLGSSVHGILQARTLEWVSRLCSRGSSRPRDQTHVSYISCIGRQVLYHQHHLGSLYIYVYIYIYIERERERARSCETLEVIKTNIEWLLYDQHFSSILYVLISLILKMCTEVLISFHRYQHRKVVYIRPQSW